MKILHRMKTGLIGLLFLGGFLLAGELHMTLSVKVLTEGRESLTLLPGNFELMINGMPRPILDIVENRDVLKIPGLLKRNFVLSFHVGEYQQSIAGAVAYFVYQILQPGDQLMVVSPLKGYSISVGGNKEKVLQDIENRIGPDCLSFRKHQIIAQKKLKTQIAKLHQVLSDDSRSSDYDVQRFKDINMFLNVYPLEMEKYCRTYLIPRIDKYDRILEHFSQRGGNRWWLHFQERESGDLMAATRRMIKIIQEYFRDQVSHFSRLISNLENVLKLSESFSGIRLKDIMVKENVCYNAVFFGGEKSSQQEAHSLNGTGLIKEMDDVARGCGGRVVVSVDPKSGIKEIENHPCSYLELVYLFNGRIEPKVFQVTGPAGGELVYMESATAEEVRSRVEVLENSKVSIGDFRRENERIAFSISRFKLDPREKAGILNVHVSLRNDQGKLVYQKERTLRATQNKVDLRLSLPGAVGGGLSLTVRVIDLVGNHQDTLKQMMGF